MKPGCFDSQYKGERVKETGDANLMTIKQMSTLVVVYVRGHLQACSTNTDLAHAVAWVLRGGSNVIV